MLVDSHCHLNYKGLVDDLDGVLERARAAGIDRFLTINTRLSEFNDVRAIAERYADVTCTVGVHPHEAESAWEVSVEDIVARTEDPLVAGIGESGLDYYYDNAPREAQRESFRKHIAAAQQTGLPLVVHSREAEDDTAALLREAKEQGPLEAVMHCFTGSRAMMEAMVDLGFYISLSGIVTFKTATDLQETAKAIPPERLLVETDSPFLAPVPHRGRPCEPAYVADTARFVADLRGMTADELAALTTENFFRLFERVPKPAGAA